MATKYYALLTNVGAAKLANATALGEQVEITQMAVGDGNGALPTPNPAQTALVHELRRAPLNTLTIDAVNTNQIIAEQVIPEGVGGWWIREIGLYDSDGDLIAIANCAETYKPLLQEGSGRVQIIRVVLIVSSTQAVTLKIDPSVVLATRQYVDDKVIEVKSYANDLMEKHLAEADPHKQYPLITNALKEMADAGLVSEVLKNLHLREAINGTESILRLPAFINDKQGEYVIQTQILTRNTTNGLIVFPEAFDNKCLIIIAVDYASAAIDNTRVRFNIPTKSQCEWFGQTMSVNPTPVSPSTWAWLAIGY
ncbi:phage tail protein [Enterobacter roggenkampii]|nr:phage tail protein [Enterobacter roggenkampii]